MTARRCAATAAILYSGLATAASLSPDHWPTAEREELQRREFATFPASGRTVSSHEILVTGTMSPVAVHAGVQALRQGGTAADAAATVALTQIATDFGSVISYAGISELLYFDAKSRKVFVLDAGWGSYSQETDPATIPPTDLSVITGQPAPTATGTGALGRQTLLGGFMAGIEILHKRFGHLKFAALFEPAIWYAEHGVTVSPVEAYWFQHSQRQLWRTPAGHKFASMPDGSLPKAGDQLRQPELAHTLEAVAARGAAYMYTGEWAHHFVAAVRAEGGAVTAEDLARYQPVWREPLSVEFGGATVFGPPGDLAGSCGPLEALNLLDSLRVAELGPYWRDPTAFRDYVEALRFAQYAHYSPDVRAYENAHGIGGDCKSRLTPQYAANITPHLESLLGGQEEGQPQTGHHSASIVVVDKWGNVAAMVHSINAVNWGDTGIVVDGIPIGDAAAVNCPYLLQLKPGDRVPNDMSPVIALEGGKPVLAVASVGSSLVPETTRLVAGLLMAGGTAGADPQSVMSAPPLILNTSPFRPGESLANRAETVPADAYEPALLQAVKDQGLPLQEVESLKVRVVRGTAVIALIDQATGTRSSVEIPTTVAFAESEEQQRRLTLTRDH